VFFVAKHLKKITTTTIAFFAITPTKEKKGDDNKLVITTHFCFKQKEKNKG